ncbi:MAG: methyltransferase domain-containing protein [Candidatus Micrarchaeota archaeon]
MKTITGIEWKSFERFNEEDRCNIVATNVVGKSVLDLGCGEGHILNYVREKNKDAECLGIDGCAEYVSNAKKNYPKIQFKNKKIQNLGGIRADTVLLLEVIEHSENPVDLIKIAKKHAKKRVIISVPYLDRMNFCLYDKIDTKYSPHYQIYDVTRLRHQLRAAGLTSFIIRSSGFHSPILKNKIVSAVLGRIMLLLNLRPRFPYPTENCKTLIAVADV